MNITNLSISPLSRGHLTNSGNLVYDVDLVPIKKEPATQAVLNKKKKENTMCLDCEDNGIRKWTVEETRIDYLSERAYSIKNEKRTALARKFGIIDDEAPETAQELVDRILAGKFVLGEKKDRTHYSPVQNIQWRDPAITKDEVGFKAAAEKLAKEHQKVVDTIQILPPEQGLKALQEYEAATIN
jgi:hypothetical protein